MVRELRQAIVIIVIQINSRSSKTEAALQADRQSPCKTFSSPTLTAPKDNRIEFLDQYYT